MTITAATRLDTETSDDLDEYAEKHGISRAEAIKRFVVNNLAAAGDGVDIEAKRDFLEAVEHQESAERLLSQAEHKASVQKTRLRDRFESHVDFGNLDPDMIDAFAEQPYVILPKAENEAWVVSPRFVPFHVGWLEQQTKSFNIFLVNKYVGWIEELPPDIRDRVGIGKEFDHAIVDGATLELDTEEERDRAWDYLGGGGADGSLLQRVDDRKIQIKQGKEFDVIAELVEAGNLPFAPHPVDEDDLRPYDGDVELRSYQERGWERFVETGMIGVYWAPGAGKTVLSAYAGDRLEGRKLVVVPNSTLKEQWLDEKLPEYCEHPEEWDVQTYQYFNYESNMEKYQELPITLTVFDESHRLPANTFSKLATIGTKYRMGLTATPYREDDRTEYIFALTGYPIGMNWEELKEWGYVKRLPVKVYLYATENQKVEDVPLLVAERPGKIVVFSDSIARGQKLSAMLDAPFVHGDTRNRMDVYRGNRVVISSRVGDEGLSMDDLDAVINHDFHGGSRRQELQRFGRVLHGESEGEYIIQMTDDELENHGKRLYSLEERGFEIRFVRRS